MLQVFIIYRHPTSFDTRKKTPLDEMYWIARLLIVSPVLLVGSLFVLMRMNESVLWSWGVVLIPEWILLALWLALIIYRFVVCARAESKGSIQGLGAYNEIVFALFCWICISLFSIFITIHLETGKWPWAVVICPLWVLAAMAIIYYSFVSTNYGKLVNVMVPITIILFVISSIFIAIQLGKANPDDQWNWALVFLPIWVALGAWTGILLYAYFKLWDQVVVPMVKTTELARDTVCIIAVIWASLVAFFVILTVKLENAASISNIAIMAPVIILFCLLFIMALLMDYDYSNKRNDLLGRMWFRIGVEEIHTRTIITSTGQKEKTTIIRNIEDTN